MKIGGVYILIWGLNNFNAKEWYFKIPDFRSKKSKNSVFSCFLVKMDLWISLDRIYDIPSYKSWCFLITTYICAGWKIWAKFFTFIFGLEFQGQKSTYPKNYCYWRVFRTVYSPGGPVCQPTLCFPSAIY